MKAPNKQLLVRGKNAGAALGGGGGGGKADDAPGPAGPGRGIILEPHPISPVSKASQAKGGRASKLTLDFEGHLLLVSQTLFVKRIYQLLST